MKQIDKFEVTSIGSHKVVAEVESSIDKSDEKLRTVYFDLIVKCGNQKATGTYKIQIKKEKNQKGKLSFNKKRTEINYDPVLPPKGLNSTEKIHYNILRDLKDRYEDRTIDCNESEFNSNIDFFF